MKVLKDGEDEVKNVENIKAKEFIAKVAQENNLTEEQVEKDFSEIRKFLEKEYGFKPKKVIKIVSSENIPDDFADIHNLPAEPGPENDLTLLGVDANENGIRDDMERIIAYSFRNYPELVDIHNVAEKLMTIDNKRYQEKDYSDESMEDSEKMSTNYVECAIYYNNKYNISSSIHELSKLDLSTAERNEAELYHMDTNLYSLKAGLQEKYRPVASEKFCQDFINKYRK